MKLKLGQSGMPACAFLLGLTLLSSYAIGQVPVKQALGSGEVTGSDVYVRSGPSLNHYTVLKLEAGSRVTVVGENGEWYEILPPAEAFSLVSGDYIDSSDGKHGVVNGNNVRVRAGSLLNENKYTVQTLLSKGAEVTIVGRNADGFLRIAPPEGATVWVNRSFIEMVPGSLLKLESEVAATPADGTKTGSEGDTSADDAASAMPASPFTGYPITELRTELELIDRAAQTELEKPVMERRLEALVARYQVIAEQVEDEFAQQYAAARVRQLTDMAAVIDTVRQMRKVNEQAESRRREYLQGRAKIRETLPEIPTGLDVKGVLRTSALYPADSPLQRFRLVDTSGPTDRTIAYIEVPVGTAIDAKAFLDQYVGVRASSKRLQQGGVDPVAIYVAGEIVPIEPEETKTTNE